MINDLGVSLNLASSVSPKLLEWHVAQATHRQIERKVALKLGADPAAEQRVDLSYPQDLLRAQGKKAFSPKEKIVMRCILADAFWPRARLHKAGYDISPKCPLCDTGEDDTLHHRAWVCPHPAAAKVRERLAGAALINEARAAGPEHPLFARGLRFRPCSAPQLPAAQKLEFWHSGCIVQDRDQWQMSGLVYYDGSAHKCSAANLNRATFAVVQVDGLGNCVSTLQGTVPAHMPQNSQAAEHCGRAAAVQSLSGASILTGDCKAVVDLARSSDERASHHSCMYAGSRRAAIKSLNLRWAIQDRRVAAHRSLDCAVDNNDYFDILCNDHADRLAKAAHSLHGVEDSHREQQAACDIRYRLILRVLISTVPLWPASPHAERCVDEGILPKKTHVLQALQRPHAWLYRGNEKWMCTQCQKLVKSIETKAEHSKHECRSSDSPLRAIVSNPQGHTLAIAADAADGQLLFCVRCGAYAVSKPRKLLHPCRGKCREGSAGRSVLERIASGQHPDCHGPNIAGAAMADPSCDLDVRHAMMVPVGAGTLQKSKAARRPARISRRYNRRHGHDPMLCRAGRATQHLPSVSSGAHESDGHHAEPIASGARDSPPACHSCDAMLCKTGRLTQHRSVFGSGPSEPRSGRQHERPVIRPSGITGCDRENSFHLQEDSLPTEHPWHAKTADGLPELHAQDASAEIAAALDDLIDLEREGFKVNWAMS